MVRKIIICIILILTACDSPKKDDTANSSTTIHITENKNAAKQIQAALINVKPGGTIELAKGHYKLTKRLSLNIENVTIKGLGEKQTILSFAGQKVGSEGLTVTTKGSFTIENLAIEDAKGDALKIKDADRVIIRGVRIEWTAGPKEENGAYGIYPVQCKNILIENCIAIGASDAGIYVGQSQNIIVRNNVARQNVAGIEIENSKNADVYKNTTTQNSGGILVFDLPNLPVKGGSNIRVFENKVTANNHRNFAPKGNIVAQVPPGTGVMVMANDKVEIFNNTIGNNQTSNTAIISYFTTGKKYKDKTYDPFPEGIFIHDNTFEDGGNKPSGELGKLLAPVLPKIPDIIWDGVIDLKKIIAEKRSPDLGIYIKNNGKATFANINILELRKNKPNIDTDIKKHSGELPKLPAVKIANID